jgi:proton glutamate symport protein
MFRFTNLVMYMAPLAVGSAMAYTVSSMGLGILQNLLILIATFFGAILLFVALILVPIALWARIPLLAFGKAVLEPVSIAFATASSEAALPKAMTSMEQLGASRYVVSFVMPAGYSFNMDGGTLYLALGSIFIAQASGKYLSISQELVMIFTLMLASKGIAGVPRAALAILTGMSAGLGLPAWPIFILFGIDGILDMGRSALNVLGNCLATVVIAQSENEFNTAKSLSYP